MVDPADLMRGRGSMSIDAAKRFPGPRLRPCAAIAHGDDDGIGPTIAARYAVLTHPLELAGGLAMRPTASGGIAVIEELYDGMPWAVEAIDLVARQVGLSVWAGRAWLALRPLILVGPPASGKSHLARLIASVAGVPSAALNLGGADDARALAGTARGWSSAQPCWPAVAMANFRTANPLLILEEIDKVDRLRGRAAFDVLLAMTERLTSSSYYDTALLAPVNLSAVNWIMTANDLAAVPPALRSRVDVVRVEPPPPDHFPVLVDLLTGALAARLGVARAALPDLPGHALAVYRDDYARRRDVRLLARRLEDGVAALVAVAPALH